MFMIAVSYIAVSRVFIYRGEHVYDRGIIFLRLVVFSYTAMNMFMAAVSYIAVSRVFIHRDIPVYDGGLTYRG